MRLIAVVAMLAFATSGCGPSEAEKALSAEVKRLGVENTTLREELKRSRDDHSRVSAERDALRAKPAASKPSPAPAPAPARRK